ncbi:hypothetical protein ACFX1X_036641 [Malus domestica]
MITTGMFDVLLQVLLGDVGAGKSSLVLSFVKEQFVEFQVLRGEAHLKFTGRTREEADSNKMVKVKEKNVNSKANESLLRRKAIHTANKAAQRYECELIIAYCTTVFRIFLPCALSLILKNFIITRTMTIMMITAWRLPK